MDVKVLKPVQVLRATRFDHTKVKIEKLPFKFIRMFIINVLCERGLFVLEIARLKTVTVAVKTNMYRINGLANIKFGELF